jgi:threonyl-tRNA synthetase
VDFNLPEKFNIEYVDTDGVYKQPITIHRALLGSLERFFGILIEHYAGSFPLWLAPTQVIIMSIADRHNKFADELNEYFKQNGIRTEKDFRNEKIGFKIREAEVQKVPFMLVIGDAEVESGKISVRRKGEGDLGTMTKEDLMTNLNEEINNKKSLTN